MPTAAASAIERAQCRVEPALVYRAPQSPTLVGKVAATISSMKSPHQRLSQIGGTHGLRAAEQQPHLQQT
jgi:hypothetical protein